MGRERVLRKTDVREKSKMEVMINSMFVMRRGEDIGRENDDCS